MPSWQQLWRDSLRDPMELLQLLGLQAFSGRISMPAEQAFGFRVPRGFAAKMRYGDINDPLLRQVLPLTDEESDSTGYRLDAVGDMGARQAPGVLHKYQCRALLVSTRACAINCRYCFRRHFPYAEETAAAGQWQQAIRYLREDPSIHELLLSGGDPLALSTAKLAELTGQLACIPHLRRLRIHTRLPIVLPQRVDDALMDWLRALPWPVVMVVHANHDRELCDDVQAALWRLAENGITLLNQSVLLKGVNDDPEALVCLSERLFDCRVLPYYLHQLDKVQGASHFEVPDATAIALHQQMMKALPGYLVPKLVREIAGQPYKSPIS